MLVKLLGILDIFVAICFWLFGVLHWLPERFILILGIILLVKGLIFIAGFSIASLLDIILGIVIAIASSVTLPHVAIVLIALFILQKGIFSML